MGVGIQGAPPQGGGSGGSGIPEVSNIFRLGLDNAAIAAGSWEVTSAAAWLLGFGFKNTDKAQNDELDFEVNLAAGTYTIELEVATKPEAGIITVKFDDTSIGTIDNYAAGATYGASKSITGISVSAGLQTLKLVMATKNASASAYELQLGYMRLLKTA